MKQRWSEPPVYRRTALAERRTGQRNVPDRGSYA